MMKSKKDYAWVIEPSVAIDNCLQECRQMRSGSIYLLSVEDQKNALHFATQTLADLDLNSRAALICLESADVIISGLGAHQGPADLRSYTLRCDAKTAVLNLIQQLARKLNPVNRLIVCVLPVYGFDSIKNSMADALHAWRDWCERNGCILLFIVYGDKTHELSQTLAVQSRFFSGIACLKSQTEDYVYQIYYWINRLGVQGAAEFLLQDKSTRFELVSKVDTHVKVMQGQVFLQRSILDGAPVYMADRWSTVESWQELVEAAGKVPNGTFVFALYSSADVELLARILYGLRQQRGAAVGLVVREMSQLLRNKEVQLLMESGASLVVSADTHLARLFSKLENLQGHSYSQPLTQNLESAIAKIQAPDIKGLISVFEFTNYVTGVLENSSEVDADGVLVSMQPANMLTVAQVVGQLNILRKGDVACAADGIVYLFLFGCQLDFVRIALQRIFSLPYKELLTKYQVYSDCIGIRRNIAHLQLSHINEPLLKINSIDKKDPLEDASFENKQSEVLKPVVFSPRITPLPNIA